MHSHNYREAGPFAGQRVVVVGAAASGEDIGREIAETAAEVRHDIQGFIGLCHECQRTHYRSLLLVGAVASGEDTGREIAETAAEVRRRGQF